METLPYRKAEEVSGTKELSCAPRQWIELLRQLLACAAPLRRQLRGGGGGLADNQLLVLLAVEQAAEAPLDQRQLSAAVGLSPAQVSGIVETLRQTGLVQGSRDAADRRRQCWRLSETGQQRLATALAETAEAWAGLQTRFSAAMAGQLSDLLAQLENLLTATTIPRAPGNCSQAASNPARRHAG